MGDDDTVGYWSTALRSLGRNLLADLRHPRHPAFVKELLATGLAFDVRPRCQEINLLATYPTITDMEVDLGAVRYTGSNINPYELFCIHALSRLRDARRFFEFGTFDGGTTQVLARTSVDAEVFTLDLAETDIVRQHDLVPTEAERVRGGGVGSRLRGTPEAQRVVQLFGDSRFYDFEEFLGTIDVVFVDASHDYEYVRSDSLNALRLVGPAGLILWHDYLPGWPGVIRAVDEIGRSRPVRRIGGTSLALLDLALAKSDS